MKLVSGPDNLREERIAQLIEQYGKVLLRICCVYLKDAALAEDALQETFLKAYRNLDGYKGLSSERTWLTSIAINVCRDMRRRAWFRYMDRTVDLDRLTLNAQDGGQEAVELMMDVMNLPKRYMEVILLHYYADLTQTEIARMIGVTPATVSKRLKAAQNMLRHVLEGGNADDDAAR